MKRTMDGAKKNAEDLVAQHILPNCPYHLSLYHNRQYPKAEEWWFNGPSARLQYQTFSSDAERGFLYIVPPWVIVEEEQAAQMPPRPVPKTGERKKITLSEALKRKQSPMSPMGNNNSSETPVRSDSRVANGSGAHKPPPPPPSREREREREREVVVKKESLKPVERSDARRVVSKTDSRPRSQPEPESRKRVADTESSLPPQKRPRSEQVSASKLDREYGRQPKPEPPRGRDRGAPERTQRERDTKNDSLRPTTNGLAPASTDRDRENTASPRSTIQVNGSRVRPDSGRSTPRKGEGLTKSLLPELLSPLHPSLEAELEEHRPRRKLADKAPPRSQKADGGPPPAKKRKPPVLPELLSPTLPAIVEEALIQSNQTPARNQSGSQSESSPSSARKTIIAAPLISLPPPAEEKPPPRPSRIVTLKLKKANAKRAKDLLSLPSKSAKDALKKERSISVEATPPPARKRPRPADEIEQPPAPPPVIPPKSRGVKAELMKNNHNSPSTPLRVPPQGGSASQPTPLRPNSTTPLKHSITAAVSGSAEAVIAAARPPTRDVAPLDPKTIEKSEHHRKIHQELVALGTKIKHTRDDLSKSSHGNPSPAEEKRLSALHLEMVLTYFLAFYNLNLSRTLAGKSGDIQMWESLLPHIAELRGRQGVRQSRCLKALACQLHASCLDQIVHAYFMLDEGSAGVWFRRVGGVVQKGGGCGLRRRGWLVWWGRHGVEDEGGLWGWGLRRLLGRRWWL
ncbi:hypothetical protein QC763_605700 [Podospora pseudopauciseta]|uniref:Uncharacterized protein n=1 Tax=Podospora pseudopauciseta TaxID=2093780 RepID=A0ABR0H473_9PEZI|nr:hypothetical protein QC763_605700 [Podospora pseudopauciseta]